MKRQQLHDHRGGHTCLARPGHPSTDFPEPQATPYPSTTQWPCVWSPDRNRDTARRRPHQRWSSPAPLPRDRARGVSSRAPVRRLPRRGGPLFRQLPIYTATPGVCDVSAQRGRQGGPRPLLGRGRCCVLPTLNRYRWGFRRMRWTPREAGWRCRPGMRRPRGPNAGGRPRMRTGNSPTPPDNLSRSCGTSATRFADTSNSY